VADNGADVVRLLAIREESLSVDEVWQAIGDDRAGGSVLFVGSVRDEDGGKPVQRLEYTAHPTAEQRMREVAESVAGRWPATAVAAVHRVGALALGDIAVVVAVACPHRGEAFEAARALIDELKATVPIWKHQIFSDGTEEWVGTP
jgi:molybdopterin synthase catalytic subunit